MPKTETETRTPDLREAFTRRCPTRWVLRMPIGNEQWAMLVEYTPGIAPTEGGFKIQQLREDGTPAHKLDWSRYGDSSGLTFCCEDDSVVVCPLYLVDGLEDGLAVLADIEEEGFRWDGTIYETDREKLRAGIISWKPWKEGESDA